MATKKTMEVGVLSTFAKDDGNPFDKIAEHGVTVTQLCNWDTTRWTDECAALTKKQAKSAKVRIAALWTGYSGVNVWNLVQGPATMGLVPPEMRRQRVADLKAGADFAVKCGAPAIITHCGFIPESPADPLYNGTIDAIGEVAAYCHERGLGFWFETGQETPVTLLRAIEDIGLENLGINLDTANIIMYGKGNPLDSLDVFGKYVRNLHAKDGVYPTNGRNLGHEVAIGEGKVDFKKIVPRLAELGFTGDLVIEREISGDQQTADIMKAIKFLRGLIAKIN